MNVNLCFKVFVSSQAVVVHAYNPRYLEGRNQEDGGSKAAPSKQFMRPYLKNTQHTHIHTKGWQSGSSGRVPA
jgi:phage-related protein